MSWKLREKARSLLAQEEGTIIKDWGGKISVALIYPNTYYVGMSNLGFQTIYYHLNQRPDVVCERVFLPDPEDLSEYLRTRTSLFSLESQQPLLSFDFIAFSVPFENDYLNILRILRMVDLPLFSRDRTGESPLVAMGGICAFSNPEPMADFMDFFFMGEGEEVSREVIDIYKAVQGKTLNPDQQREAFLERLLDLEGVYVPRFYNFRYREDGRIDAFLPHARAPFPVRKRILYDINSYDTISYIRTPNTEFGTMALLEIGRGCGRGCRFCLEGEIYRPIRHRSLSAILRAAEKASANSKKIGLLGACVSDYPWIDELCSALQERNLEVSVSSLRADTITETLLKVLKESGHKTITLAPEAGTERLRSVIHKQISDAELLKAIDLIASSGIPNLKLYFMVGLPTETDEDILAIAELSKRLKHLMLVRGKDQRRLGRISLSINAFIPKPWTAFQWVPFEDVASLESKIKRIKQSLKGVANIRVTYELPKWAYLQAFLARADRRASGLLLLALDNDGNWRRAYRQWSLNPDFFVYRQRPLDEVFPWDHLEIGVKKERLIMEYRKAGLP